MAMDMVFTSLMDLATTDTSEVKSIRSRLQAEGIYVVMFTEVGLSAQEDMDMEKPRANLRFVGTIENYEPLKQDDDSAPKVEDMLGKRFSQFSTLWLEDMQEAIGLLKGQMYERAHLPTHGIMGGIPDHEGWLDSVVGQRVAIRVRHSTDKEGNTRAYYDWLSARDMAKIDNLEWEDMGRDAVWPDGTPMELDDKGVPVKRAA